MPYLHKSRKDELRPGADFPALAPGDLNFQITEMCLAYIAHNGPSYRVLNDVVGALESAKLEFYRRAVAPYEDDKIRENGDVY
jgi:hypothetical protein